MTHAAITAAGPLPVGIRAGGRDLRLDFFRGLALLYIFLDHVPSNVVAWLTLRNYGFSDATEIFVFISGYSAALAYGRRMQAHGLVFGTASVLHRAWEIYIAHIFLFVLYSAQIAWIGTRFHNPMFAEEANLLRFLDDPLANFVEALLLRFRPANMDVLPLYIVLLLGFAPALWCLLRRPWLTLTLSAALYLAAGLNNWNLPAYPPGSAWYFNPLCWQFLFLLGAACALYPALPHAIERQARWLQPLALAMLIFALAVTATWHLPEYAELMPEWLAQLIYPISKTNLDPLRLLHFLALAWLAGHYVGADAHFLRGRWAAPLVLCGRHSLHVFCLGILLAFAAHFYLVEFHGGTLAQLGVSVAGAGLMLLLALLMEWYRQARQPRRIPETSHARED